MPAESNAEYVNIDSVLCWATFDDAGDIEEVCSEKGYKWADEHAYEICRAVQNQIKGEQENFEVGVCLDERY